MRFWTQAKACLSLVAVAISTGCSGGANSTLIDTVLGAGSQSPVLSAVPTQTLQQTDQLKVDVNNVKKGMPGDDKDMSYSCKWSRLTGGPTTTPADCLTLPNGSALFNSGAGLISWTPSSAELGQYKISITGSNQGGSDTRDFTVDVRLHFGGLESLTNIQGDRMTLNWTANPQATGYQVLRKNSDGTYGVFQTITNPALSTITLTGLVPLTTYNFRLVAIDRLGSLDGNSVSLSAVTADLIRMEVTSSSSQLSPGQTTTVTVRLKDNGGNYINTSGLNVSVALAGNGTSSGTFSAVNDLGNGVYTSTFTATTPGTADTIVASLPQFYFVETAAPMQVLPLKVEITASALSVNPNKSITLTARIRDFNGIMMSQGGQGLAFTYGGGTSTATMTPATDLGNGTYTATLTGGVAGTAVTIGAVLSTTSQIYSTVSITVLPYSIEVTSALADLSVTRTATVTARVKDWQGNYLSTGGQNVQILVSGSTGIVTLGATTDNNNGTYTAQITGLSLGTISMTAQMTPSFAVTVQAPVTVRKLRVEILASTAHLMPGQTATLTGRVKDWQGNVVGVGGEALDFSASGGTSAGSLSTVTDNANGTYNATFTASSAGTALTVSGSITDIYQVDATASITVEKWRVYVATSASSIETGQVINATVTVKDYLDNQASSGGQTVSLVISGGTSTGIVSGFTDNGNGTYSATITAGTTGTTATVSATLLQSYQVITTASLTVTPVYLVTTVQNSQMNPGGSSYVYAQIANSSGTAITTGSYTITFGTSGGTSTGSFSAVAYMGNGLYRSTFTGATGGTAVNITASATSNFTLLSTQAITVVPWSLKITSLTTAVTVGQSITLTGKIYDYTGAFVSTGGKGFAMSLVTSGIGSLNSVVDNSDGTYTSTFTANDVGSTAVSGQISASYTLTSTVTIVTNPLHLAVTIDNTQLNPAGQTYVYAQLKDGSGANLTLGTYSITFTTSGGTSTGVFSTVTNQGNGLYRAQFTASTAGTALTVSAQSATTAYVVDSTASLTVVPWSIRVTSSSTAVTLGQSVTLTAKIYNYSGAQVSAGGQGVSLSLASSGIGTLSPVIDNNDGSYTSTFTAAATGSSVVNASIASSFSLDSTVTLTTTAVYLAVSVQNAQMNPAGTSYVYAQVQNSGGTNLSGAGYSVTFATSGGTSTGSFGTVSYMGSGLYRALFTGATGGTATTITASSATYTYVVSGTPTITVVPWSLKITASSTAVTVGQSVTLTGKVYDYTGAFVSSGGKGFAMGAVTTGIGNLSSVTDNSDGTYTTTFSANAVGSTSISGTITSSYTLTSTVTLASTAVHLYLTATQSYLNPGDGVTITAVVRDAGGTNLLSSGYTIGFNYSGGTSTGSLGSTINLGTGAYTSLFTGNVAGTGTTITAYASVPYVVDQVVTEQVVPWNIRISSSKTDFAIYETGTVTAIVKDWNGVMVTTGGKGISLSLASAGIGSISSTTDMGDGTYVANFQAQAVGSVGVNANMSQSFTTTLSPTLNVGQVYIYVTVASAASSTTINSGNQVTAKATLKDAFGNVVSGTGYSITFNASGGSSTLAIDTAVTQASTGVYQITYHGVTAGTATTITASANVTNTLSASAQVTVIPSTTISPSLSTLTVSAPTVRSALPVTLTATLKDANGNLIPGLTGVGFTKSTGAGVSTGTISGTTDGGNGIYTATFTGGAQGTATTITAASGGVNVSQTVTVAVTSGVPSQLVLTAPASVSSGSCSATGVSFAFQDANGNSTTLAADTTFTVNSTKLGYAGLYSDPACNTLLLTNTNGNTPANLTFTVLSGASSSPTYYFKSYYPTTYQLGFSAAGIAQSNSPSTVVNSNLSWIGMAGNADAYSSGTLYPGSYYAATPMDGAFMGPTGVSISTEGSNKYLYVTDQAGHTVQKFDITSMASIGYVGTLGRTILGKGVPTGGTDVPKCTGYTAQQGIDGAYCTGGQYQGGSGDAMMNAPFRTTVMSIGGVNYLYVSDTNNHRILKYKADGTFVGWSGYISSVAGMTSCTGGAVPGAASVTTPGWCKGGTATAPTNLNAIPGAAVGASANGGNQFRSPTHITNDGNMLYVYDSGNNRLDMIDPTDGANGGLVVRWMGRVSSSALTITTNNKDGMTWPTAISCYGTTQSDGTSANGNGNFSTSWCTGGASVATGITTGTGTNVNLNPHFLAPRGIWFYNDGTYNWMLVADGSFGRIGRYLCGPATATPNCSDASTSQTIGGTTYWRGNFFGYTGWTATTAPTVAANPTAIASLFNSTQSSTSAPTNGWAYWGGSQNTSNYGGYNSPYNLAIVGTTAYVAETGSVRIEKVNLVTGAIVGWSGRISSTPTGGASGCAGANAGSITPGWCTGGTPTTGAAQGGFNSILDIATDGTYLFTADRDNYRIQIHNLSGNPVGTIGLRANTQPQVWSTTPFAIGSVMPANSTLQTWYATRDQTIYAADQIFTYGNYIYVSETGNNRIKRYRWTDGSYQGWIGLTSGVAPTGGDPDCIGTIVGGFTPGWCKGGSFTSSTSFGFSSPRGMASDGTYLYIADTGNHRIVRVDLATGQFKGWIGGINSGSPPSDGESTCSGSVATVTPGWCLGGAALAGRYLPQFNTPYGLAGYTDPVDGKYYLIVGDTGNNRLVKIDVVSPTGAGVTWVGVNSSGATNCGVANGAMVMSWCATANVVSNVANTTGQLNNGYVSTPRSIYIDFPTPTTPTMYVSGNNGHIQRFNPSSGAFTGWVGYFGGAGSITGANCDLAGAAINTKTPSWCTGGTMAAATAGGNGQLSAVTGGIYADATYVYVTDVTNNRIMKWDKATGVYIGWTGRIASASGLGGGTGCVGTLPLGAITPAWCTGGTSMGGYLFDTTNKLSAFDTPLGLTGFGNLVFVLDQANGRIVSIPTN